MQKAYGKEDPQGDETAVTVYSLGLRYVEVLLPFGRRGTLTQIDHTVNCSEAGIRVATIHV